MELYVDDDGYICFMDGNVFWTLHSDGWEAFLPDMDVPCFYTWKNLFPTDDELAEVQEICEIALRTPIEEK